MEFLFSVIGLAFFFLDVYSQDIEMKTVFNGQNLDGWVVPDNNIWWSAQDGILAVKSGPNQTGSILWTDRDYNNFVIELEFMFGSGTIDSGIFLRKDSHQIQIGISGSLERDMTGSPYIAGKGYPVEASGVSQLLKLITWNTFKVQVVDNVYQVWLNGQQVLDFEAEDKIESGPLGLQLHANRDMSIDFRNIKIGYLKT